MARHVPEVWSTTTPPQAALAARGRERQALHRSLGDHTETPDVARAVELLSDLVDGMVARGLVADVATSTPAGRQLKDRVEAMTDVLAVAPYDALDPAELDELVAALEPLARRLTAAHEQG